MVVRTMIVQWYFLMESMIPPDGANVQNIPYIAQRDILLFRGRAPGAGTEKTTGMTVNTKRTQGIVATLDKKAFWGIIRSVLCPLRLVAQDIGFSVRKQGFDSPRGYLGSFAEPLKYAG